MNALTSRTSEDTPALSPGGTCTTIVDQLCRLLAAVGVLRVFAITGGGIAPLWAALLRSRIKVVQVKHETTAAYNAAVSSTVDGAPGACLATTGPGAVQLLAGLMASRIDGGRVIALLPVSAEDAVGGYLIQETRAQVIGSQRTPDGRAVFTQFVVVDSASALRAAEQAIAEGLAKPGGFVIGLFLPTDVQTAACAGWIPSPPLAPAPTWRSVDAAAMAEVAAEVADGRTWLWVGDGARGAWRAIRRLVDLIQARVLCSPRALGIVPAWHPCFVGVTGIGGHADRVRAELAVEQPRRIIVLGTRLGAGTRAGIPALELPDGLIHVDIDPTVFGIGLPMTRVRGYEADVGHFVEALLDALPRTGASQPEAEPRRVHLIPRRHPRCPVRPWVLLAALQSVVVDLTDIPIIADSGSAFVWAVNQLRPNLPNQVILSTAWGAMGISSAVVGAAMARHGPAIALVGDGALHMLNEINTAATYRTPAIWIVLHDDRYNIVHHGVLASGLGSDFDGSETAMASTDFVALARALGAEGARVEDESQLDGAIRTALEVRAPYVLDVIVDRDCPPPMEARIGDLEAQGARR